MGESHSQRDAQHHAAPGNESASEYIDFLERAFNTAEVLRAPARNGKLVHATVRIGDSFTRFG